MMMMIIIYFRVLPVRPQVYIEQRALDTIAHLCDGDARTGLNGLQLAVQARVAMARSGRGVAVLVQETHIKEGLQRSHILYDKAGMLLTLCDVEMPAWAVNYSIN